MRLTPTPMPSPFGIQQIDLSTALGIPVLPMTGTPLPIDLVVPVTPALAGLVLDSQAIVLRAGVGLSWTNLIGDVVFL